MDDDHKHDDDQRDNYAQRMTEIIKGINGGAEPNPAHAPNEADVHYERLRSFVSNITQTALMEIGALRDECGELIRTVHDRQETLLVEIHAFSTLAKGLLESKRVMAEALDDINTQFRNLPIVPTLPNTPRLPAKSPAKPAVKPNH
jgi:hypothetical protein